MGNRQTTDAKLPDLWWSEMSTEANPSETVEVIQQATSSATESTTDKDEYEKLRRQRREAKLKEFKADLEKKQTFRREAIAERSREIVFLRDELVKYKKENEQLKDLLAQNSILYSDELCTNVDIQFQLGNVELSTTVQSSGGVNKLEVENFELKQKLTEFSLELVQSKDDQRDEIETDELKQKLAEVNLELGPCGEVQNNKLVLKNDEVKQKLAELNLELAPCEVQENKLVLMNDELEQKLTEVNLELAQCGEVQTDKLAIENGELKQKITELTEELLKSQEISTQNSELRKSMAEIQKNLQSVNGQVLEFEQERKDYATHVVALKDVIHVSKQLLLIRENQLDELKSKITDIESSLAEREASMLSSNLRQEYERQLRNIRSLRTVYEQRQAAMTTEHNLLEAEIVESKKNFEDEQKKNGELQERITELDNNVWSKYEEIQNLESQLGLSKAEFRGLEAEMTVINQLFSQILYGFSNCQGIDFDKLVKLLEQNHDLLTDIVENEECESISSALPKVLLDLVNQVNKEKQTEEFAGEEESTNYQITQSGSGSHLPTIPEEQPEQCQMQSAEEIVTKLPKVWRVLIELLRQQSGQQPVDITEEDPCYKSVQTPKGPKLVLSVSKTYIRLKDLILEKKSLEKEMSRLKQLNSHLEVRLQDQEKRLETVSTELSKTWHVVGRMQKQHQQLHTHEKILRYELGQKRKMLTELKAELEYCREKWEQARQKNSNTEVEWRKLRSEFASRKAAVVDDLNNSAESGYSDERECSSDDESYNKRKKNKTSCKETNSSQNSDTDDASSHIDDINTQTTDTEIPATENPQSNNQLPENNLAKDEKLPERLECSNSTEGAPETNTETPQINNQLPENNLAKDEKPRERLECSNYTEGETEIKQDNQTEQQLQELTENTIPTAEKLHECCSNSAINKHSTTESTQELYELTENPLATDEPCSAEISAIEIPQENNQNEQVELHNLTANSLTTDSSSQCSNCAERVTESNESDNQLRELTENILATDEKLQELYELLESGTSSERVNFETTESSTALNEQTKREGLERTDAPLNITEPLKETESVKFNTDLLNMTEALNDISQNPEELDVIISKSKGACSETTIENSERVESSNNLLKDCTIAGVTQIPEEELAGRICVEESSIIENTEKCTISGSRTDEKLNVEQTNNENNEISTENEQVSSSTRVQTQEEMLARREARLKRMEEQCLQLVQKVTNTNQRGTQMSNRLESLHEQYGNDPATSSKKE